MNKHSKTFAFQLAAKEAIQKEAKLADGKWTSRQGPAIAGCSDPTGQGDYRYRTSVSADNGVWC